MVLKNDVASYLENLINSNYDSFMGVFSLTIQDSFNENKSYLQKEIKSKGLEVVKQEFFEGMLYTEIYEMFEKLNYEFTGNRKRITRFIRPNETPATKLGFADYFKQAYQPHIKILTTKGVKQINSYRAASGLNPIEEAPRNNNPRLHLKTIGFN